MCEHSPQGVHSKCWPCIPAEILQLPGFPQAEGQQGECASVPLCRFAPLSPSDGVSVGRTDKSAFDLLLSVISSIILRGRAVQN